jgi:hypothetical protein
MNFYDVEHYRFSPLHVSAFMCSSYGLSMPFHFSVSAFFPFKKGFYENDEASCCGELRQRAEERSSILEQGA